MTINRRDFLRAGATTGALVAGVATTAVTTTSCAPPGPPVNAAFPQGVASGDPLANAVLLWTRAPGATALTWEVASDMSFADIVASGSTTTSGARDWCATVDATGLLPATTYYYRWSAGPSTSPIGRTRTAPAGAADHLRFAVVSCSNVGFGWFHNYRAIAERSDLDAVIHLGDYIYEYAGSNGSGETYGEVRPLDPPHEILTLDDYRRRYRCYRDDADLAELHRQHPMIHVWDDHEFADDPFVGGATNHQPDRDGSWPDRVDAALTAYREWMPTRLDGNRIFRVLEYGDLARIVVVDRQRRFLWPATDDAGEYLGREQAEWLHDRLTESSARWLVLAQQTTFGATARDGVGGGWGAAERARVFGALDRGHTDNLVVLTGDIHRAHAMDLIADPAAYSPATGAGSAGVEFSCGSVTSPGGDSTDAGSQVRWNTGTSRTYLVLDITPERTQGDVFGFPDLLKVLPWRPDEQHLAAFVSDDGARHLRQVFLPAPAGPSRPLAPAPQ